MRISVNSRVYQNRETGIPKFIKSLYSSLRGKYPDNDYVFLQTSRVKRIGRTKIAKTAPGFLGDFLFDNFYISRLIREVRPGIFHGPAHVLPFSKIDGVRYVLTIHDLTFLFYPEFYSRTHVLYYRYVVPQSIKKADIIIADSLNTKNDLINVYGVPEERIKVIYLGVQGNYFTKVKESRVIKEQYFLSLITHPRRKNLFPILDIIARIKKLRKYKYVIAGSFSSDQFEELKTKIRSLRMGDRVIFAGFVSEQKLINLYQYAEFFLYPSLYEGFGLPVLEAMASKCPVITSNTSSLPEIVPNKTYLVDPNDQSDIEEKIIELLGLSNKKRSSMIENNYRFAKKFSWSNTAKEYLNVFKKIL